MILRFFRGRTRSGRNRPFGGEPDTPRGLGVSRCRGNPFRRRMNQCPRFAQEFQGRARKGVFRHWRYQDFPATADLRHAFFLRDVRIPRGFRRRVPCGLVRHRFGIVPQVLRRGCAESRGGAVRIPVRLSRFRRGVRKSVNYPSTLNSTVFSPTFPRQFQRVTVKTCPHFARSGMTIPAFGRGFPSRVHSERSKPMPVANFGTVTWVPFGRFGSAKYRVHPSGERISR